LNIKGERKISTASVFGPDFNIKWWRAA